MAINIDHYQDSGPLSAGRGSTTTLIDNIGWMSNSGPEGMTYALHPIIRPTGDSIFTHSYDYYTFFKLSGTYIAASRPRIRFSNIIPDVITVTYNGIINGAPSPAAFSLKSGATDVIVMQGGNKLMLGRDYSFTGGSVVMLTNLANFNAVLPTPITIYYNYVAPTLASNKVRMYYELTDTYNTPTNVHDSGMVFYPSNTTVIYPKISTIGPTSGLSYPKYLTANTTYYTQYLHMKIYVPQEGSYTNIGPLGIMCYVDEYESTDL